MSPAHCYLNEGARFTDTICRMQGLVKTVPDQPKTSAPVHLRTSQYYARKPIWSSEKPFVPPAPEAGGAAEKATQ